MKNKKIFVIAIIILLIIVVGLFIYFKLSVKETISPPAVGNFVQQENSFPILNPQDLIGSWKAVFEEVNTVQSNNVDFSITFNSDGSYFSSENSMNDSGLYKLTNDSRIIFYYTENDLSNGNYQEASGNINENNLTLIYPAYPRVVVFERE